MRAEGCAQGVERPRHLPLKLLRFHEALLESPTFQLCGVRMGGAEFYVLWARGALSCYFENMELP